MAAFGLKSIEDSETDEKEKNMKEHRSLWSEVMRWNINFTEEAKRKCERSLKKNKVANKQVVQRIEFDKEVQEQQVEKEMDMVALAMAMPSWQQRIKIRVAYINFISVIPSYLEF